MDYSETGAAIITSRTILSNQNEIIGSDRSPHNFSFTLLYI